MAGLTKKEAGQNFVVPSVGYVLCTALVLLVPETAFAKDIFHLSLTASCPSAQFCEVENQNNPGTQTASIGFTKFETLLNSFTDASLRNTLSLYTPVSKVDAVLDIRGLGAFASYAALSTRLNFSVPSIGVDLSFQGQTRDQSQALFRDYLTKNGGDIISRLFRELAATSPIDPVAGNPNSLMATMSAGAFDVATGFGSVGDKKGTGDPNTGPLPIMPNQFSLGGDLGLSRSGGYDSFVAHLPLRYIVKFRDSRYRLTFNLPMTYIRTEGAQSGMASFGTSLEIPVIGKAWSITPSVQAGLAGSLDLGSAAAMYSGDVTSSYAFHIGETEVRLGNGVGYYKSGGLTINGRTYDYGIQNTLTKNGISVSVPLEGSLFGDPLNLQAYIIDTHAFGDRLYIQHYDEIGLVYGTTPDPYKQMWNSYRIGLTYTVGRHYNAGKFNFGYRF